MGNGAMYGRIAGTKKYGTRHTASRKGHMRTLSNCNQTTARLLNTVGRFSVPVLFGSLLLKKWAIVLQMHYCSEENKTEYLIAQTK